MFCTQCGANIPDTVKFCPSCGKATGYNPDSLNNTQTQTPAQPQTQNQTQPQTQQPPQCQTQAQPQYIPQSQQYPYGMPPKKNNTKTIGIAVVAVLVIAAVYLLTSAKGGADTPKAAAENLFNAATEEDTDAIIQYSILNKKIYEQLYDDKYDKDTIIDDIQASLDEDKKNKVSGYDVGDSDTYKKGDDEFDGAIESFDDIFDNTDCIEAIATVDFEIKYKNQKESNSYDEYNSGYDTSASVNTLVCFQIDGKWYTMYYLNN